MIKLFYKIMLQLNIFRASFNPFFQNSLFLFVLVYQGYEYPIKRYSKATAVLKGGRNLP
ncbi:hypothetical protein JOC86_003751 [Bacillus pakistanensis]|uniref:Uncharacterized protein n=1 Tax=Rossellomorea pakistanensis TaxID=992288 RepID=A0ABS2NH80_9BACI|nr:hypothetical protein [Bacillus pakistanensis]